MNNEQILCRPSKINSMKKQIILIAALFIFMLSGSVSAYADDPNPPVVPGTHGAAGNVPVGAPVDDGIFILMILGIVYGAKKIYDGRVAATKNKEEKVVCQE